MKTHRRYVSYLLIIVAALGVFHGLFRLGQSYFTSIERDEESSIFSRLNDKKVLYISAYNNTFDNVESQVRGLKSVFDPENIALDVQYIDIINFEAKAAVNSFYRMLKMKTADKKKYDAVILGDNFALSFALEYQNEFFKYVPMIFIGVDDNALLSNVKMNPFITGFIAKNELKDTIEIAMKIYPRARIIYALYDDSHIGKMSSKEFYSLRAEYPGYLFRGINASNYSREDFGSIIGEIGPNNIVVCLGIAGDNAGNWYSNSDTTAFVASHAKVPVFSSSAYTIGRGFLGGKVIDNERMAKSAAQVVKKALDGTVDLKMVPFEVVHSEYLFDSSVMRHFKLRTSSFDNIVYLNKARDYWQRYYPILSPFIEIFVFLLFLFGVLITNLVEVYKSRKAIAFSATHDSVTDLYNRYSIARKLEEVIGKGEIFSVVQVDIDDFHSINDFNSYKCGDAVLRELGSRIKTLCDEGKCYAARFDGDDFLLIYKGVHFEENDPELYFLRQLIGNSIEYDGKSFFMYSNAGIVNSNAAFTSDDYFANVDIASNAAKRLGRNKYVIFNDEMKKDIVRNSEIGHILEEACKNDDFDVFYQPQIAAASGEIHGYEALVRLPGNRLSPASFIPIAEKDGHIVKIGRIVTEKVIQQMAQWRSAGLPLHRVSINFSVGQISDVSYIDFLSKLMRTYDIPPELIGIEITESLLFGDRQQALDLFRQFNDLGIKIALDDFGTGYSSLSYLTYLPVYTVKLDKTMIDTYLDGQASFIENIVNLVHSLGMKLTVEGVEEKWQYDKLCSFKCDYIQGYFFSKPLSNTEIESFVPRKVV